MSFCRQSDHRRGERWPSLAKPWRSGIVQDQNERKLELSLGPLRDSHPQLGRAGHVSRVHSPQAKREGLPLCSAGVQGVAGPGGPKLAEKDNGACYPHPVPRVSPPRSPQPTFPQNQRKPAGCWILTWHRVPAAENGLRAPTRPPFIHLRPPVRGGGDSQWWETLG